MIVGGAGFMVNYLGLAVFFDLLGLPILLSQIISAELALLSTFVGNNFWAFTHHHHISWKRKLVKFHLSALGGIVINSTLVVTLVHYAHMYYGFALVIGSIAGLMWNYTLYKRFVFNAHQADSGKDSRAAGWLSVAADLAPVALPAALAAFGSVAVLFVLLGQFRNGLVWPLGLLAAALICIPIVKARGTQGPGSPAERNLCNTLAILGAAVWIVFNIFFAAQHFLINRDPGTYTTAGAWLVRHDNLEPPASHAFGNVPGIEPYSAGFMPDVHDGSKLNAQGQHLLPALLGLSGRIVGIKNMVRANVLLGGIALLALYGFARLLVRPRWALVATATVSLALPMMYFSRDTYTEPLAMSFTFGALALLWMAQKNRRLELWLAAGVVAGAGALTRIDGYLTLAAIMAFLIIMLALSGPRARKRNLAKTLSFAVGATAIGALGFEDVSRLSTSYYLSQRPDLRAELLLLAALVPAAVIIVTAAWRTGIISWLDAKTRTWRVPAIWTAAVAAGLLLSIRPLLYSAPSYSQDTVNWLIWYLGPVLTVLGGFGLAYTAAEASKRKDLLFIPAVFVIGGTALFYLLKPNIAPDQIWASRRLLPVIMPGMAVFGAVMLERLYARQKLAGRRIHGRTLAIILATLALVGPLFVSLPFLFTREDTWYGPAETVCRKIPRNSAVLWVGVARARFVEPTQVLCNV
ncbi:MAG: GtrA family protein, partial [Candidatus Saccharimonadales bacterium]